MIFIYPDDIYPFTHTTKKQKFVDDRWKRYEASRDTIRAMTHNQMQANGWSPLPEATPFCMATFLTVPTYVGHKRDSVNIQKAIEDALQGILFQNDGWCDFSVIRRLIGRHNLAIVAIELERDLPNTLMPSLDWLGTVMQIARQKGVYVK